jgi:AsmA protein
MQRVIRALAILVAVVVVFVLCLPFLIDANRFRPMLEAKLGAALGRKVAIGDLRLSIFAGGIRASDLAIGDDPAFGTAEFVRARVVRIRIRMLPLILSRRLEVTGITIQAPDVRLMQNSAGRWNFASLGAGKAAAPAHSESARDLNLSVKLVDISDGRFVFQSIALENVKAQVRDFSAAAVFPFSFSAAIRGGGSIALSGTAGPIQNADASRTPVDARISVNDFNLAAAGFGGTASLDGTARSDGSGVEVSGRLKGDKLKLVRGGSPAGRRVEIDCAITHDLQTRQGSLRQGDIHIGRAAASLTGTFDLTGPEMRVNLKLAGSSMPLEELAAMLPALDVVLPEGASIRGGAGTVQLTTEGPLSRLSSSGSLRIENTRLAGFDLGSKMSGVERLAGIRTGPDTAIQLLSANFAAAADGTRIDAIQVVAPAAGELTGSGAISPAHELAFAMRAVLHGVGIPFMVAGTAQHPVFKPDVKGIVGGELKAVENSPARAAQGLIHGLIGRKPK